jgi:anti-sigma factor (TIGR02949 family)
MTIENEKVIAGLSCGDVLARLSEYLDGELSATDRARVETHLRGCDGCARFGGELRATVHALRARLLARPAELPRELTERLSRALDADTRLG